MDKTRWYGQGTVNTLYVTENRKLVGVLSLLDIVTADDNDKIEDIMEDNVISVDTLEDKEYVASCSQKYDFLSLPVVEQRKPHGRYSLHLTTYGRYRGGDH